MTLHILEKDGMPSANGFALIIVTAHVVPFVILFGILRGLSG